MLSAIVVIRVFVCVTHGDDEAGVGGVFLHQQVTLLVLSPAPSWSSRCVWQQMSIMGEELGTGAWGTDAVGTVDGGGGGGGRFGRAESKPFSDRVHSGDT